MKFIRYQQASETPKFGWIHQELIGMITGSPFGEFKRLVADIPISRVKILAPVAPGKIVAVGRNYLAHAREHNAELTEVPLLFLKPPSSVIGPGDAIILPPQSELVEHEAELAVVIGRTSRWLTLKDAPAAILGYTIANDVTARDLQKADGQWTRGKGFDTFCPLGPWIETDLDPSDVLITCRVDGEMRQMASSREMVFPVAQLLVYISSIMTLNPGDVVLTGTPAGVGPIQNGNIVEINIEGIGELANPVSADTVRMKPIVGKMR